MDRCSHRSTVSIPVPGDEAYSVCLRHVQLRSVCGFAVTQELRDPIPERCPRCGRWWRR